MNLIGVSSGLNSYR